MEFGICIPHYGKAVDVQKIIENTQYAEKLGFDSVWVTDHIVVPRTMDLIYRDNMLEPVALLSHLAGLVPRVKLGTSVLILPYRNPIVLAKMLATIDQLSGGRLIVGVGGGESTLVADLFARGYRNITLSKQSVDSALAREIVAELRNEGHVEEEVRGTIRLTPRGYRAFQNDPSPYSYRSR